MYQKQNLNISYEDRSRYDAFQNLISAECVPGFYGTAQAMMGNREYLRPTQQGESMDGIGKKAWDIVGPQADREKVYGHPAKNLQKIAKLWSAYLDKELTPYDVSNLMVLLKTARLQNAPAHEDTLVDIIGYAMLQERVKDADKVVTNT